MSFFCLCFPCRPYIHYQIGSTVEGREDQKKDDFFKKQFSQFHIDFTFRTHPQPSPFDPPICFDLNKKTLTR